MKKTTTRTTTAVSRRRFLRGVGGASLALPFLESLKPAWGAEPASQDDGRPPLRQFIITVAHSQSLSLAIPPRCCADHSLSQRGLIDRGVIPVLTRLLNSNGKEIKEHAAWAVRNAHTIELVSRQHIWHCTNSFECVCCLLFAVIS